jgi:hypothetical protein
MLPSGLGRTQSRAGQRRHSPHGPASTGCVCQSLQDP